MATRTIGKTWTIGQKTSTRGQDDNRVREAKLVTGRDVTDERQPSFAANSLMVFGNPLRHLICADRFACSDLPIRANDIA
jgi:hypothetical protein